MKKNILTISVVAVVIIFVMWYFMGSSNSANDVSSLSADTNAPQSSDAIYIYSLLQKMPKNLDTSIFSNSIFQNLVDNTVILTSQDYGRNNPFAPIGSDAGSSISATTTRT